MRWLKDRWASLIPICLALTACKPHPPGPSPPGQPSSTPVNSHAQAETELPPRKPDLWKDFRGDLALQEAQNILGFGPRPAGSEAIKRTRDYLLGRLSKLGWQVIQQRFSDKTPDGAQIDFCNLIARFSGVPANPSRFIVAAHYDTYRMGIAPTLGATDGAANTAILLELARVLSEDRRLASTTELLFLDGHAATHQLGLNDGLFGSRFYAQMLQINQHTSQVRGVLSLENMGGKEFHLAFPPNSDPGLSRALEAAGKAVAVDVERANRPFLADHVPFQQASIPTIALLDPNASYVNTADDNGNQLNADSLAKVGRVVVGFLSLQPDSIQK